MIPIDYAFIITALGWAVSYNNALRFDKNLVFHLASVIIFGIMSGLAMVAKNGAFT